MSVHNEQDSANNCPVVKMVKSMLDSSRRKPEREAQIAKIPQAALEYAARVIKGRFIAAERYLANSPFARDYLEQVLINPAFDIRERDAVVARFCLKSGMALPSESYELFMQSHKDIEASISAALDELFAVQDAEQSDDIAEISGHIKQLILLSGSKQAVLLADFLCGELQKRSVSDFDELIESDENENSDEAGDILAIHPNPAVVEAIDELTEWAYECFPHSVAASMSQLTTGRDMPRLGAVMSHNANKGRFAALMLNERQENVLVEFSPEGVTNVTRIKDIISAAFEMVSSGYTIAASKALDALANDDAFALCNTSMGVEIIRSADNRDWQLSAPFSPKRARPTGQEIITSRINQYRTADSAVDFCLAIGVRVPELESVIAREPEPALSYASEILNGRFEAAEKLIAGDGRRVLRYAEITQARFPAGEPAILEQYNLIPDYTDLVFAGRWPSGEQALIDGKRPEAAIYAIKVIGDRWHEAESFICSHAAAARLYSCEILRSRWPEAEPYIATNRRLAEKYVLDHLDSYDPELIDEFHECGSLDRAIEKVAESEVRFSQSQN